MRVAKSRRHFTASLDLRCHANRTQDSVKARFLVDGVLYAWPNAVLVYFGTSINYNPERGQAFASHPILVADNWIFILLYR